MAHHVGKHHKVVVLTAPNMLSNLSTWEVLRKLVLDRVSRMRPMPRVAKSESHATARIKSRMMTGCRRFK